EHVKRDGPNDQHEKHVKAPSDFGVPFKRHPPLQNQQQQCGDGEDDVHFVERVFFAAIKRATGAREQIGYTEADDDGHERGDELETAHQVLSVLHGVLSLRGAAPKSRCKWLRLLAATALVENSPSLTP